MRHISIKRGLDLPLGTIPGPHLIHDADDVSHAAVIGDDYTGLRPKFLVKPGDTVKKGRNLFYDKRNPSALFTAPCAGTVTEICRGPRRKFLSLIIKKDPDGGSVEFPVSETPPAAPDIIGLLLRSGLWTSIRQRPFNTIPLPEKKPGAIFITAIDTNPLAPPMDTALKGREAHFMEGVRILSKLTEGPLFVCKRPDSTLAGPHIPGVETCSFSGPHPAGNAGTHIARLFPGVSRDRCVWHVNAQDAADMGELFATGNINSTRIISIAGPGIKTPGLYRVQKGACIRELISSPAAGGSCRTVSGSVLNGRNAEHPVDFLGRFHSQVTLLPRDTRRPLLGWLSPGLHAHSATSTVASRFTGTRKFTFTTGLHGGIRAIYPTDAYEKVNVFNTEPVCLLRSLAINDIDTAENLGCLHLAEEDLALFTYVCPAKVDHGRNLRRVLTTIQKEG